MEVQSPGPTNNIVQQSTGTSCAIPTSSTEVSSTSSISNITAPINLENLDKECSALAGLFQQTVNDMKNGVPHYDELVSKAAKLHSNLKSTILVLSSFLDTFQKIADAATNTKGATREIGACLTRIVLRHKAMESRMKTLCSALLECMILPLQDKLEEWRKTVGIIDKEHAKEYKKLRAEVKKKWEVSNRLKKKNSKQQKANSSSGEQLQKATDLSTAEVEKSLVQLQETEKNAVRRALTEERSRYCAFVHYLRPVLTEETGLVSEFQQLEEVTKRLGKHTDEPFKLPKASEQVINDMKSCASGENGGQPAFNFQTPPSSPSSLGSRKSSMCSISSAGSGSTGTGSLHHSPSHHPNGPNKASHLSAGISDKSGQHHLGTASRLRSHSQIHNTQSNALGPMRLSSISSQDSGFTSQDTLFLPRPSSPSSRMKEQGHNSPGSQKELSGQVSGAHIMGNHRNSAAVDNDTTGMQGSSNMGDAIPLSDRPHTISSAYEKSGNQHQRPQLQPYTFNPPESTLTIPESCELSSSIGNNHEMQQEINRLAGHLQRRSLIGSQDSLPPPPPPPKPPKIITNLNSRPGSAASNDSGTMSRPALPPGKTIAATMAAARQQQQLAMLMNHEKQRERSASGSNTSLPNFNVSKNDMIVPQPVYMNTNDLAELAAQKKRDQQMCQYQGYNPNEACDDSQDLKTPTAENQQILVDNKVHGDGSSSNSESSLGSSSGYGSQNTVKVDEINQQLQKQKQNRSDGQNQQPGGVNPNNSQRSTDARFVHHTNHPIPQPMMLLDSSQKYNTNYNETIAMQNIQPQYSRSHSHPAPSHFDAHDGTYNPSLQRPYSFADGQVANLTEIHGNMSPTKMPTLRRGMNQQQQQQQQKGSNFGNRPNPPMRRTSSVTSSSSDVTSPTHMLSASPPPPPAPAPHVATNSQFSIVDTDIRTNGSGNDGSNSTTPRGSMENLPPPPPDLLNSDEDEINTARSISQQKDHQNLIAKRGISVAESVKALQQQGHTPCSPKSLRRAHSIAVPPSSVSGNHQRPVSKTSVSGIPSQNQIQPSLMQQHGKNVYNQQPFHQNNHQMQQQTMYTNHQQPQSMGMYQNQNSVQQPKTEQIYAPVAHLQQKMIHQQKQASAQQQASFSPGSPESTEYGFGVQFQQHQSQFYQTQNHTSQQLNSHHFPGQHQDGHLPSSATSSPHHPNLYQQQYHPSLQHQPNQQQAMYNMNPLSDGHMHVSNSQHMIANNQNHMYKTEGNHDQIMGEIDTQLRHRPQPPPIAPSQTQHPNQLTMGNDPSFVPSAMAEQTALRVRKWIESRSVPNVKEYRPLLNAQIQQGFALRKTAGMTNDRSAPRF